MERQSFDDQLNTSGALNVRRCPSLLLWLPVNFMAPLKHYSSNKQKELCISLSFFAVPVLNDTTSSFTCCLNMIYKLLSSQLWRSSPPCALWSKAWDAFSCVKLNRDGTRLNKARIQYARVFVNVVLLWPNWEEISEKCVYFSLCGGAVEMVVWGVEAKYK